MFQFYLINLVTLPLELHGVEILVELSNFYVDLLLCYFVSSSTFLYLVDQVVLDEL